MKTEKLRRIRLFVAAYLKSFNATDAAVAAGYKRSGARTRGYELLQLPKVQQLIREAEAAQLKRLDLSADRVLAELAAMAFVDVSELHDDDWRARSKDRLTPDQRRAIVGVKRKDTADGITLELKVDKAGALEKLARHLGLLKDKLEVSGSLSLEELILGKPKDGANG